MPRFPPPNAATQQQLGINVTAHLQDGGSKSVYACVLVGGANNGLGAVVAIEATIQAAEPEAVRRLVSRPLHPNVIRGITHVHAAGPPGILYTVSEQLQVELFDNVINGGVILEGPARAQFAECVTALRHMHRMGVAHRDIKLENIMLSAQGVLKMIDFDLCEIAPTLPPPANNVFGPPISTSSRGSRSYAAPEVMAGMYQQGIVYDMFLADVWSLGVVLFTMVTGFFFVDIATNHDFRFAAAQQAQQAGLSTVSAIYALYNRPNPLSAPLVALLDGMLTINPAQRITIDQIAAAPSGTCSWLETVRGQLTLHDNVVPLAPELWRLRARQRWAGRRFRVAIAAVLVLRKRYIDALCVERSFRPGGPGALSTQQHFEATAPVYDSMGASDSPAFCGLSADDPSDLAVPAPVEEPSYRGGLGGEDDALRALVKHVKESMGLESVEPPPLKRQNAEDVAGMVAGICPTDTLKRKALS